MNQTAYVFPGQGSQSVGMVSDLAAKYPQVAEHFQRAGARLGVDLFTLVQDGPAETLNRTEFTQPALLTASVAIWQLVNQNNPQQPAVMAGHSLGEYSALVCAGALDFEDAVALVHKRGQYMQQAVAEGAGAMAAVLGLEEADIVNVCREAGGVVSPANFNSPGQIVIAGEKDAVQRASELASAAGAKRVIPLAVSVPSHCELMRPAAELLAQDLHGVNLQTPKIPVIQNVDVAAHEDPEAIKQALVDQLHSPVQWTRTMQAFADRGIEVVCECGPGKVLSGLFKRFDRQLTIIPMGDVKGAEEVIA